MDKKITQLEILKEYFMKYPNKNIKHPEVVDWVTNEWEKEQVKSLEIQIEVYEN